VAYRVLIIVPEVGLDTREEVVEAASGFEPTILSGVVTRQRVLKEIAEGGHDIVYFGTHGREHVLQMSDGIIEEDLLEHAVRKAGNVRVLFLNACRSAHASAEVYNNSNVTYSIGWPGDVGNQVAKQWAKLFFEALRMAPANVKEVSGIANDAIIKSYRRDSSELPIVLNGRLGLVLAENRRLQDEMKRAGIVRVPTWMVISNILLIVMLLLSLLLLTALH